MWDRCPHREALLLVPTGHVVADRSAGVMDQRYEPDARGASCYMSRGLWEPESDTKKPDSEKSSPVFCNLANA